MTRTRAFIIIFHVSLHISFRFFFFYYFPQITLFSLKLLRKKRMKRKKIKDRGKKKFKENQRKITREQERTITKHITSTEAHKKKIRKKKNDTKR